MASKVIVKMPSVVSPFSQVKSKSGNNVNNGEIVVQRPASRPEPVPLNKGPENARIAQLEQNIRFLKDQHELMLTGLQDEIEKLKSRNKDLQFQLVFVKGSIPSSPSSPEDDTKHKVYCSPKPFNVTPLQVEILEKEIGELKLQQKETESRNVYLSAIVEEQKKKLERYERDREKERDRNLQPDPELLRKLDDAEAIIRRLQRQNSDLRRENAVVSQYSNQSANQQRDHYQSPRSSNQRGRHHRGGGNNHQNRTNWFPPLHSQSYWQGGRGNERNSVSLDGALPSLADSSGGSGGGGGGGDGSNSGRGSRGRRGANNNYNNGEGGGRKYRGGYNNSKGGKPS